MSSVDITSFSLLLVVFVPGRGLAVLSQLSSIPMKTASLKKRILLSDGACSICKEEEGTERLGLESIRSLSIFWEKWLFYWGYLVGMVNSPGVLFCT